jgi:hypothetical protein
MFSRMRLRAVLAGVLIDLGSTFLLGALFEILIVIVLLSKDVPKSEFNAFIFERPALGIAMLTIGMGGVMLGGFAAAAFARQGPLINSTAVGVLSLCLGLVFIATSSAPVWFDITGIVLTIPFAMAGGAFYAWLQPKPPPLPFS